MLTREALMKAASLSDSLMQASWICLCNFVVLHIPYLPYLESIVAPALARSKRPNGSLGVCNICVQFHMQHGATIQLQPTHSSDMDA